MSSHKKNKICFIIPHFGEIPGYFDFFILTASRLSPTIDFIFFTDQSIKPDSYVTNVFVEKMDILAFNNLCFKKLKIKTSITNGYKLCDLKPMYGLLFEDYLHEYGYWGHCDFDMIFGDIQSLLSKHEYQRFDIFCVQELYASGPFQIFRNLNKVNSFFTISPTWKNVFLRQDYIGFDEAGDVIRQLWAGKDIWDCKAEVHSMTHLLKDEQLVQKLDLKIFMKELITENFSRGTKIIFDRGKLFIETGTKEIYIYHFMNRKNRFLFNDQLINKKVETFFFSDYGFYTQNRFEFSYGLLVSLLKRCWVRFKRKIKNAKTS
ncbi:MAG TPA: DUF6625 family protein [Cyclobacteriaceae bacterium]|jgi:hypothetical protein|nr:DUF6625 family protein [Cyclobacteriaceae bacterium]